MSATNASESLSNVLNLSRRMIDMAKSDEKIHLDVGCRVIFGALRDYGYALKKMVEKELAQHAGFADSPAAKNPEKPVLAPGATREVLIVDDEPDFARYLALWFEDQGFTTRTAKNGHEGLASAREKRPDLITLDISMPEKSGVSTYREFKDDPEFGKVPVVIITGIGQPFNEFISKRKRVPPPDGFVAKPVDLDELARVVRELMA
ncbi:MAG: response regulator [Myxococcales bacterium]|nr:MAG: response regulator [Myxococcales bacterium]